MLSKKYYKDFVKVIASIPLLDRVTKLTIAETFSQYFTKDNPRFDYIKFMNAVLSEINKEESKDSTEN